MSDAQQVNGSSTFVGHVTPIFSSPNEEGAGVKVCSDKPPEMASVVTEATLLLHMILTDGVAGKI